MKKNGYRPQRSEFSRSAPATHYPHNAIRDDRVGPQSVKVTTATVRLPQNVAGQNRQRARDTSINPGRNTECPVGDSTTKY